MFTGRIEIEDLEIDDVIWVDKVYGWCEVKQIFYSINRKITLSLSVAIGYSGLYRLGTVVTKTYTKRKIFQLYE